MGRKLLDRLRDKIRVMHYSPKTEDAYASWVKRFILFHHKRHPQDMGKKTIIRTHSVGITFHFN